MQLKIVAVGAKAPDWVRTGFDEYAKRIPAEMPLNLIEIPAPRHQGDSKRYLRAEGEKTLAKVADADWMVALDERGRRARSTDLAAKLGRWRMDGLNVSFVIGGADGLDEAVRQRANETLSLSDLTFPHYLARLVLVEAIYRAWTIHTGHPYHRA